jgi:predicted DNA binding CopG/RHH family protein
MRKHYDFSQAKKNPYARRLKKSITIRLDQSTVGYFKSLAAETELPYQSLINLYLRDCAATGRRLALNWRPARKGAA